jgi:hypothetical protein
MEELSKNAIKNYARFGSDKSPSVDLAMQSALFAILYTCSKGNQSDAFKNAYFQFEYMVSGGVQRLSHDDALQLVQSLDSNELVLSKCTKCATAIVSKRAGISTIDCCAL